MKLLRLGSVGAFLEKAVEPPPIDAIVEAEVLLRGFRILPIVGINLLSYRYECA